MRPGDSRERSIQRRFWMFHAEHPQVFKELLALCRQAKAAGRQRIGISMLWEVMRWNYTLLGVMDDQGFKLNNDFRSRYARLIAATKPRYANLFEFRELKAR